MQSGRFGFASGIRFAINALFPSFVVFQTNRSKSPDPHPGPPRKALEIGLRFSAFIRSAVPRGQIQDLKVEQKGNAAGKQKLQSNQSSALQNFLKLPERRKARFFQQRPPCAFLSKSCICRASFRLEQTRKQRSAFSKSFQIVCTAD